MRTLTTVRKILLVKPLFCICHQIFAKSCSMTIRYLLFIKILAIYLPNTQKIATNIHLLVMIKKCCPILAKYVPAKCLHSTSQIIAKYLPVICPILAKYFMNSLNPFLPPLAHTCHLAIIEQVHPCSCFFY